MKFRKKNPFGISIPKPVDIIKKGIIVTVTYAVPKK
jgi:hypothetical protein